jgi:hypothetical protein
MAPIGCHRDFPATPDDFVLGTSPSVRYPSPFVYGYARELFGHRAYGT